MTSSSDSDVALDEIIIETTQRTITTTTPSTSAKAIGAAASSSSSITNVNEFNNTQYDPLHSPIHFCDNSIQSDDSCSVGLSVVNNGDIELLTPLSLSPIPSPSSVHSNGGGGSGGGNLMIGHQNLTTIEIETNRNSKSRRMEYSMKGMKLAVSNNPSQDSAFGSMTDGDISIGSSSFRLNSFQSISSPIDEGVEELQSDNIVINNNKSPLHENSGGCGIKDDDGTIITTTASASSASASTSPLRNCSPIKKYYSSTTNDNNTIYLELPTLLINDQQQQSIYTTSSPSKTHSSIEVFSQKYRVSSFEDMTTRYNNRLKKSAKFRSFEEERRIESAFKPMPLAPLTTTTKIGVNSEKYKKLTHSSFTNKIINTREKHILWKNSIIRNKKSNLIKSNESLPLLDSCAVIDDGDVDDSSLTFSSTSATSSCLYDFGRHKKGKSNKYQLINRVNSINEISSYNNRGDNESNDTFSIIKELKISTKKSKSEKFLFKNSDEDYLPFSSSSSSCSNQNFFLTNSMEEDSSDEYCTDSPSHCDACKLIGGLEPDPGSGNGNVAGSSSGGSNGGGGDTSSNSNCSGGEENVPLLDGMEMSPITPTEPEEIL